MGERVEEERGRGEQGTQGDGVGGMGGGEDGGGGRERNWPFKALLELEAASKLQ